ncbi:MAG: acetylxylan esterase [Bacteroidota bacterium]
MLNLITILKAFNKYGVWGFLNKRIVMIRCVALLITLILSGFNHLFATHLPVKNFSVYDISGQVNISISPSEKNGVFTKKTKVGYKLNIKNGLSEDQKGTIYYKIENENGTTVLEKTFDINVPASKKLETTLSIPHSSEGSFKIVFQVELNNLKSVFNFNFVYSDNEGKATVARAGIENAESGSETPGSDGEIKTILKPSNYDGTFVGKESIVYNLELRNNYPISQEGTFRYAVKESITGTVISEKQFDVKLDKKSNKSFKLKIATPPQPGIYNLEFAINTSTYDDTTHYAFGYEVAQIKTPYHRPDDFDEFWRIAMDELAAINPAYKIEEDLEQSNKLFNVYKVEMSSIDNIRINGILTIPKTAMGGKFPVLVGFGGYQVMAKPLLFDEFISLTVNVRGADKNNMSDVNPNNQDILTLNINDPAKYIYRGIYMDCLRFIDFLYANENLGFDLNRIAVFGGSQGGSFALITAALLNKKIKTCIADNPTFCDYHVNLLMEPQIREASFVLEYIGKYLRANANFFTKEEMLQTLSYFEIQNFMPKIKCPVLFGIGLLDPLAPAVTTIGAYNKMNREVIKASEIYIFPELAHEVPERHNTFKSTWFFEKLTKGKK